MPKPKIDKPPTGVAEKLAAVFKLAKAHRQAANVADKAKAALAAAENDLIDLMQQHNLTAVKIAAGGASITRATLPAVLDWEQVYKHIAKTGEFELLQRRMSSVAWRERYDDESLIPGTEAFVKIGLSLKPKKG